MNQKYLLIEQVFLTIEIILFRDQVHLIRQFIMTIDLIEVKVKNINNIICMSLVKPPLLWWNKCILYMQPYDNLPQRITATAPCCLSRGKHKILAVWTVSLPCCAIATLSFYIFPSLSSRM